MSGASGTSWADEGGPATWRVPAARDRSSWRTPAISDRTWHVTAAARTPATGRLAAHWRARAHGVPPDGRVDWPGPRLDARVPKPQPAQSLVVGYVPTPQQPGSGGQKGQRPLPARRARRPAERDWEEPSAEIVESIGGFASALRRNLAATEVAEPAVAEPEVIDPEPAEPEVIHEKSEREHGERGPFLARFGPHLPATPATGVDLVDRLPRPRYDGLDRDDLVGSFTRAVESSGGRCHRVEALVPDSLLDRLVAELEAWEVVVSAEPQTVELGERLARRGVEVSPATLDAATHAGLGVTAAVSGIAATGSVVLDSRRAGGRLASLIPPVHLCLLSVGDIVATPGDVLDHLGDEEDSLPPALMLVSAPSSTGEIGQLLSLGHQRATGFHVLLLD